MKEKQKSILVQKNTTQSFQKELLMHVTARMHLSCAKERCQTQKALYYIISCQWISGKAQLEAGNYICGCQGIGVQEGVWMQIAQGSIFKPMGRFLRFPCRSIYTMVCICQKSTNGNALKHWLLLYINYISILHFFQKGKGSLKYLNTGYCIHLDLELINIKSLFGILARPGQLPGFPMTPLYPYDRTQKPGLIQFYNSLSFTSNQYPCWVLSVYFKNV